MNYLLQLQFVFDYYYCQSSVADDDYDAISNLLLEFNVGDVSKCFTVTINDDDVCENNPNENFTVYLQYESGIQPIFVTSNVTNVLIDDRYEPECSESH